MYYKRTGSRKPISCSF